MGFDDGEVEAFEFYEGEFSGERFEARTQGGFLRDFLKI